MNGPGRGTDRRGRGTSGRHRLAWRLGLVGSVTGVVAGLVQVFFGTRIPAWTGAKQAPVALGLLTIALALLAGAAAYWPSRSDLSAGRRALCAIALIGPGLLCLTTVGRSWYLPAVFLCIAGVLTIDSWRQTTATITTHWSRVLLGALGICELLMAASAAPLPMALGAVGGISLLAAACLRGPHRWIFVALGTIPFAAVAWTAIVPVLLAVQAVALARVQEPRS